MFCDVFTLFAVRFWGLLTIKAIEDQIKALDDLSKMEDREKADQDELRKIAKLRQDIEFEQDDFNRAKLMQQLQQAESAREDRLRRLERDDQKDALREQITAIQEQTDAQIAALDEEQEALEEAYAARMENAALSAEAEQMMMQSSQEELIGLIGEFAPEYDALGKTLGEKLLEGFQSKVGDVVAWFEGLNSQLYAIQESAAAEAVSAASAFYAGNAQRPSSADDAPPAATYVQQTLNFGDLGDTADRVARRVQQANEDLGAMLYG